LTNFALMKKRLFFLGIPLLLSAIYLAGPMPESPVYDLSWPNIDGNIENHVFNLENRSDIKTNNEAEIIWVNDSSKEKTEYVLLYLPGFTATKMEGDPVYQDFATRYGCNVFAARLASQGIDTIEPMLGYTADRLWKSAVEALAIAEKLGNKVIIMSTSTGGTLALKLAAEFPQKVEALINLSPNIRVKAWNAFLLNKPWGLQISRAVLGGNYRTLTNVDSNYANYWYDSYRIECLPQMQELVESTMNEATFARVTCPTLSLFYFKNKEESDDVIRVDKIFWMHEFLATSEADKRLAQIENAGTHVIGCGLYSKAIPEVEIAIFSFAEEVLNLKPNQIVL